MRAEWHTLWRILGFRASGEELRGLNHRHLLLGLCLTWVVGVGRWWEDPKASVLQHLGLGSVLYVFVLATFLWLVLWPLTARSWPFLNVLTFVCLTSPPALLYAVPVRAWFDLDTAQLIRLWLLVLVAVWRVLLWARYLRVGAGLSRTATLVVTVLPLAFIVFALVLLNLERVVFDLMGGIRPEDVSVNDAAYGVLFLVTLVATLSLLPLLPAYVLLAIEGVRGRKAMAQDPGRDA